jgi:chemotaxis signal transduction protein
MVMEETEGLVARVDDLQQQLRQARCAMTRLPAKTEKVQQLELLSCTIGELRFAITVDYVDDVVPTTALQDLSHAPDWIVGALDVGGNLVPIMDVGRRLGKQRCAIKTGGAFVLCEVQGRKVGLHASEIPNLWTSNAKALRYPAKGFESIPYVAGAIATESAAVLVLGMLGLVLAADLPREPS